MIIGVKMIVKNLNKTSKKKCNCTSWFAHWKMYSLQKIKTCVVVDCENIAEVGGHVQKNSKSDDWYIIPICKPCNGKSGEQLEISDKIKLISANVSKTCGRKNRILLKRLIKKSL